MSRIAAAFEKLRPSPSDEGRRGSPSPLGEGRGGGQHGAGARPSPQPPPKGGGANRRAALIPFVTAGDPAPSQTVAIMHALVKAGADVIELGVPFSDPMADGPVIQRSSERALKNGVSLKDVLAMVSEFRARDSTTPVVLMGYANPIERMGLAAFVAAAKRSGVDGVLIVDYPPEESGDWLEALEGSGIDPIFLLSPTSSEARIASVAKLAKGYIYYVSLKGVTGAAHIDTKDVEAMLARIRKHTKVPVGVGFGIRDAETARRVARVADAVVVGSRIVQELEAGAPEAAPERARKLIAEFRGAMDMDPRSLPAAAGVEDDES